MNNGQGELAAPDDVGSTEKSEHTEKFLLATNSANNMN
jgi:hypothetical protein